MDTEHDRWNNRGARPGVPVEVLGLQCKRSQGVKFTSHWFWKCKNSSHFYGQNRKSWKIKHL